MLGAIIGDIVGSRFEFNNLRSKEFELFTKECVPTDDSIMSLAVAKAIMENKDGHGQLSDLAVKYMRELGQEYPDAGYGGRFGLWLHIPNPQPYGSYGNGSAMRVSPCGFAAQNLMDAMVLSAMVTKVTHNHPEGMKGAEATAVAIYMARTGSSMAEIKNFINKNYYSIDFTLDEIRDTYQFNATCQNTVPQAFEAFFESTDFEDAIRNSISIGGDSDTLAAICGGIAEAYYGIPEDLKEQATAYLGDDLMEILAEFECRYPSGK